MNLWAWIRAHTKAVLIIVGCILVIVLAVWGERAIRDRWADYQHNKAMEELAERQRRIDAANLQIDALRDELKRLRQQAAVQQQETQTLKELAEARGATAAKIAAQTQEAFDRYEQDAARIEQYHSDYDICINLTCPIRAESGYPCRPDPARYCEQFSRQPRADASAP